MAGPLALDHLPSPVYPARWAGLGKPAGRWPCIEEATSGTKTVAFINSKMPSKTRFSTAQRGTFLLLNFTNTHFIRLNCYKIVSFIGCEPKM